MNIINEYRKQLEDVQHILQYLHTYPNVLSDLKIEDLITPNEIYIQLEEWVKLYTQYRDMEKEFFKSYWIPIQRIGFNYYIDISDANYPIIEAFYNYFDEPYHWVKKILFQSINDLMLADDNKVNLEEYRIDKIFNKYGKYL